MNDNTRWTKICEEHHFNGNVLIAKDEEILFMEGFGYQNLEEKRPFFKDTLFRIGSITKQFTAVAILQLVEQGLIQLEDSIEHYIEGLPYTETITIHHLLSNSSGIPNFNPFGDYQQYLEDGYFHRDMITEVITKEALHFSPGERFEYSSSGYLILAYIIEQVSGLPYHHYLQQHIFDPLHMTHSGFDFIDVVHPKFSTLYSLQDDQIVLAKPFDMRIASGGGGLYSSIHDLYLWGQSLMNGTILSPSLLAKMCSVQTPINETGGYGYGIISINMEVNGKNHHTIYHPGNGPGVYAQNMIIDDSVQLIAISNVNDRTTFTNCFNALLEDIKSTVL